MLQHGVVARWQLRAHGASQAWILRRIRDGALEPLSSIVLRIGGAPPTDHQRAMAAVLDSGPGAVLSHHSAAALWGLPGFRFDRLHVMQPREGARPRSGLACTHLARVLGAGHVAICEGIPTTTPARTVFDLAALVHLYRLERTLDNAWSRRLLDGVQMARVLDDLGKRGRTGTKAIRDLLKTRGSDYIPPDSGLEGRFRDVLRRAGLPQMRRQVNVGSDHWIGRIDFVDPELPVIVQVDSSLYHGSQLDQEIDAAQTVDLEGAGFEVVRVSDFEVWYEADDMIAAVRAARRKAVLARDHAQIRPQSRARTKKVAA